MRDKILAIMLFLMLVGCSTKNNRLNIKTTTEKQLYEQGIKKVKSGDYYNAIKTLERFEEKYPASKYYADILILKSYSLYSEDKYTEAVLTIEDFFQQFPVHKEVAYMYYLKSMSNYNQIMDVGRDQGFTILAKEEFKMLINLYPYSQYASDAKWKLEYIDNILAGKEMDIGRFYLRTNKHISSINRFKNVIENHQNSMFTPEALYRLTKTYFILGVKKEAIKYAAVLGYNYPRSIWYRKAYNLLVQSSIK